MKSSKTKAWCATEYQALAPLKIWHVLRTMTDNCHRFEEKDHFLHLFLTVFFLTSLWRK